MDETEVQSESSTIEGVKMGGGASNFKPWLFQPGKSGNPGGKPKGSTSLKVFARNYLATLPDDEKIEFMRGLPKDIVWRMSEGQPHQSTDTEVKGTLKIEFASDFKANQEELGDKLKEVFNESTPTTPPAE